MTGGSDTDVYHTPCPGSQGCALLITAHPPPWLLHLLMENASSANSGRRHLVHKEGCVCLYPQGLTRPDRLARDSHLAWPEKVDIHIGVSGDGVNAVLAEVLAHVLRGGLRQQPINAFPATTNKRSGQ